MAADGDKLWCDMGRGESFLTVELNGSFEVLIGWDFEEGSINCPGTVKRRSVDELSGRRTYAIFGNCSEAQKNPGKFIRPGRSLEAGFERCFKSPVKTFDKAIGLWVVRGGVMKFHSKLMSDFIPKR